MNQEHSNVIYAEMMSKSVDMDDNILVGIWILLICGHTRLKINRYQFKLLFEMKLNLGWEVALQIHTYL